MVAKLTGVPNTAVVGDDQRPTVFDLKQRKRSADRLNGDAPFPSLFVGNPAGGNAGPGTINAEKVYENGARVLTTAGGEEIDGGFTIGEHDLGTPANGAIVTIDPVNGLKQKITNNVAGFTVQPTSKIGDVELRIVNGPSPGTITLSGFAKQYTGDSLDTVGTHQFVLFIYGWGGAGADYVIKARQ
jgi:hypothetical protein